MKTTKEDYSECGCCGQFHRSNYWGDCRNDEERFNEEDIPKDATIHFLDPDIDTT